MREVGGSPPIPPSPPVQPKTAPAEHTVQVDTLELSRVWDAGYTGKGVGLAVLDTGLAPHPDLRSRLVAFKDFVRRGDPEMADPSTAYDDHGHGTSVATVAAGDGRVSGGRNKGAAPGASVIGVKAVAETGHAWATQVLNALEWAVENKERYNIRVMNLSFYVDDPHPEAHEMIAEAVQKVTDAGIVVVAAASNDGPRPRSLHELPSLPCVVTVAAVDTQGTVSQDDDRIADLSSRGPGNHGELKPDVAAPGVEVIAGSARGEYHTQTGTSFAAPLVAGIIADWIEANPALKPADVQQIIRETSRPIPGFSHYDQGYGQIRPYEGLLRALEMRRQAPMETWTVSPKG